MLRPLIEETELTESLAEEYRRICLAAFSELRLSGEAEVEVLLYSPQDIRQLNLRTRGLDKVTDVLSYPALTRIAEFTRENYPFDYDGETDSVFLGSVVVCRERAAEQAEEYGHSLLREMKYLFVHGLLHLLGYDHENEDDKRLMRSLEELILSKAEIL